MAKKGKKYLEAAKLVEVSKAYAVTEAIEVAKKSKLRKIRCDC
jgi:large subunit ribosomal protein L1